MPEASQTAVGRLSPDETSDSLLQQTIDFVWTSLEPWKNDPDRVSVEAEEELNAQFHNFLQSRANQEFPMVIFQHEQKQHFRSRVDLSAKPTVRTIIKGRIYTKYDPLIVIEGKRLPAPSKNREREYVIGKTTHSGGIERFKLGLHGADHELAIIIGYVQKEDSNYHIARINEWISELATDPTTGWAKEEILTGLTQIDSGEATMSNSIHSRTSDYTCSNIELLHFWINCE